LTDRVAGPTADFAVRSVADCVAGLVADFAGHAITDRVAGLAADFAGHSIGSSATNSTTHVTGTPTPYPAGNYIDGYATGPIGDTAGRSMNSSAADRTPQSGGDPAADLACHPMDDCAIGDLPAHCVGGRIAGLVADSAGHSASSSTTDRAIHSTGDSAINLAGRSISGCAPSPVGDSAAHSVGEPASFSIGDLAAHCVGVRLAGPIATSSDHSTSGSVTHSAADPVTRSIGSPAADPVTHSSGDPPGRPIHSTGDRMAVPVTHSSADSVVHNGQSEPIVGPQADFALGRGGVLDHVRQRLLDDPETGHLHVPVKLVNLVSHLDLNGQRGAGRAGHPLRQRRHPVGKGTVLKLSGLPIGKHPPKLGHERGRLPTQVTQHLLGRALIVGHRPGEDVGPHHDPSEAGTEPVVKVAAQPHHLGVVRALAGGAASDTEHVRHGDLRRRRSVSRWSAAELETFWRPEQHRVESDVSPRPGRTPTRLGRRPHRVLGRHRITTGP
jgi:hypothetical protein